MSTKWGFDLDMAAVRLMRREGADWHEIAVEKIDGADIEDRLLAMVEQIDGDAPVELFLPRDQILYTDVEVSSEDTAAAEIEQAMEGRTPYPRDELDLDWEMTGAGTARVAAIALETLDEAAAFAEVRGLRVGGFSSLAAPEDFPRRPDFTSHSVLAEFDDEKPDEAPVQFVTARQPSRPPEPPAAMDTSDEAREPVLRVDDTTPVMQVDMRKSAPLNPGAPISAPSTPPRVRTDIAAAAVSDHVASLSPPQSVKVRNQSPTWMRTAAVFAIALVLTIGVATLVWKYVPIGPDNPGAPVSEAQSPNDGQSALEPTTPEAELTVIPTTPDESSLPEETERVEAPVVPDLPQPDVSFDVAAPADVAPDPAPAITKLAPQPAKADAPGWEQISLAADGAPAYDATPPLPISPENLKTILTSAPFPGPDTGEDVAETTDGIYIASIEPNNLSFDAIALPSTRNLRADDLPARPSPVEPIEDPETIVTASIDATSAVEEALADIIDAGTPSEPTEAEVTPDSGESDPVVVDGEAPAETGPAVIPRLPAPTAFAANLPETPPSRRPGAFVEAIERQQFGGRTRSELAELKPPPRPESAQVIATREPEAATVSDRAVNASRNPKSRPRDFDAIVARAIVQRDADRLTASLDYQAPDTSSAIEAALERDAEPEPRAQDTPRLSIPSSASVARQATIENAIRLNKVNLVGVYGTPADRRALVRLSSGRYVKVKVGDRVDGGTVAQITDSELLYRKGNRTLSLSMPKG